MAIIVENLGDGNVRITCERCPEPVIFPMPPGGAVEALQLHAATTHPGAQEL